jgi:hypothetical protein
LADHGNWAPGGEESEVLDKDIDTSSQMRQAARAKCA